MRINAHFMRMGGRRMQCPYDGHRMRIGTDHAHKCPYHDHFMTWALMRITFMSISGPFHAHAHIMRRKQLRYFAC